jgi:CheY-like chemotaxis protein
MFKRAVLRVAPLWSIEEASNGETALQMVDNKTFDLIFLDQYMASVEKQLLGTETARALRAKGVDSFITGLSANDMESPFLQAGANAFMFKPFPCKTDELRQTLQRLLEMKKQSNDSIV